MWTFGFGSNMSVSTVENIKGHKVLDHVVGVVRGYKMCFNIASLAKVEPAFANTIKGTDDDEIHGVAIKLSEEDMKKLDAQELSYSKVKVTVQGYNGRVIEDCFMYMMTNEQRFLPPDKQIPSARYLQLVVKGAVESGLNDKYVEQLKSTKTYEPDKETLEKRKTIPSPQLLTPYTLEELHTANAQALAEAKEMGKPCKLAYLSILGYVMRIPPSTVFIESFLGRDLTSLYLNFFRGKYFMSEDDKGKPPYPDVINLSEDEKEYLFQHMDNFLDNGEIVGYLKEFLAENDVTKM